MSEVIRDLIRNGETKEVNILRGEVIVCSVNEEQKGSIKPSIVHSIANFP